LARRAGHREARRLRAREREAIVAAFTSLCAERGYEAAGLGAVAARAGLPAARVRAHFADPGELAVATENSALAAVVGAVSASYDPDRAEVDSLVAGVAAILDWVAAHPDHAYFGYIGARQMGPAGAREVYETGRRTLAAMLERGWEYARSGPMPAGIAAAMLGGAEAAIRAELAAGRSERVPALLPDCVYAATVAFLGQEEALRLAGRAREMAAARAARRGAPGSG
jgi:AcrR family transcriptional regulator